MAERSGGDLVYETLQAAGVDTVFGIVSVHNVPFYDAMQRRGGIRPIAVRHEQHAVSMADGYARATGRLGVAVTSTGPGAANSMGGMIEAYWSSSPVLQITGQIETPYLDQAKGFIHEAKDQLGMLRSVTKYATRIERTEDIPTSLQEAIRQALSGRRRPVAVEIPIDQQYFDADVPVPELTPPPRLEPSAFGVRRAADLLSQARRPLIWAGGGVISSGAWDELRTLAERLSAGVITSTAGRGAIPEDHPLCIGNHALEPPVRELLKSSDVLLAVGTHFTGPHTQNWRLELPEKLIHVDVDGAEMNRNYPVEVGLVADAQRALAALIAAVGEATSVEPGYAEEVRQVGEQVRTSVRATLGPYAEIMDSLRAALPRDAIIVRDATIPAYTWGNRLLPIYEPRTSIYPTSVAIGPGLPLAIGAKVAQPDRAVVAMVGDGSFQISVQELATAAHYHLGVVILVFNDQGYGVLRNIQNNIFEGRQIAVDIHTPDFVKLAEAYGIWSTRVSSPKEFGPALEKALSIGGPALIDVDQLAIGPMAVPYTGTSRRPVKQA